MNWWEFERESHCRAIPRLYDEDIYQDEKRIENSDSNKRVKVGRVRVNLIPGGPTPPNCNGMTADKADAAKKRYSIDRQKFREELRRERLQAAKCGLFDNKDYGGSHSYVASDGAGDRFSPQKGTHTP